MSDERDLARALTDLVRVVGGVVDLYPARGVLRSTMRKMASAVSSDLHDEAPVEVIREESGLRVAANLCVSVDEPTGATLRRVSGALAEYLEGAGERIVELRVRASRID